MSRDKRPVCTCPVYNFPHHRDNFCRLEEDGTEDDGRSEEQELRDADNAERAADCRAEAHRWGGRE